MVLFKKIPIAATPFNLSDLLAVFASRGAGKKFEQELCRRLGTKYFFSVNSGTSAFYLILQALAQAHPGKKEVILPAYTAASLVLPIKKIGLKPKLCDISLSTFNLDLAQCAASICSDTLCVVAVHLFGLACDVVGLKRIISEKNSDCFVVEDCAQAFGTLLDDRQVGAQADISLYSFNRGKNMSTVYGGGISTDNRQLAEYIREQIDCLAQPSTFARIALVIKLVLLSLVIKPLLYNFAYPLLQVFRSTKPPPDFSVLAYSDIQAAVGVSLLKRLKDFSRSRCANGLYIYELLKRKNGLFLPLILDRSQPAFNRFPLVFKDVNLKNRLRRALFNTGIDSSGMYESPLHLIFELSYKPGDFPNAEFFAQMLLTLPTHPLLTSADLNRLKEVLEKNL